MLLSEKANNKENKFIVALDGPSAAGKGLIGSMLAEEFLLTYVQSSLVYRGLAYLCLQKNISPDDIASVIDLSRAEDIIAKIRGVDLNIEKIGEAASKISVIAEVRTNLGIYLKNLIMITPRIIMEGRDIGTVVAPNADLKIFITASSEIRAQRRFKQLRLEGKDCMFDDVLKLLEDRDKRDESRSSAPLKVAADALVIDTSEFTPLQVVQAVKNFINK